MKGLTMTKNTICIWYDIDAEAAAHFYAETFPDSVVGAVHHAPSDNPGGKKGEVMTVEFTVAGVACLGLNGGSIFKHRKLMGSGLSLLHAWDNMLPSTTWPDPSD